MLRIGIDIRSLHGATRTGIGEYAHEMLAALRRVSEHEYLLFDGWRLGRNDPRVPNKIFHATSFFFNRPRIDKILGGVDVFFSPNLGVTALSGQAQHVLTIHDLSFEFFPDCFSLKQRLWHKAVRPRKQCKEAAAIIVPSENTKRDVISLYGVDKKKVHVVPHGVSLRSERMTDIREKYQLPEKYILFVGAIEPRKNVDGLIEAYRFLGEKGYALVLAGPKGYRGDALLSGMRGVSDIRYLGYVAEEDKSALYAGASLFVYPSFYEGFGLPVLEAFSAGIPVVTSNRSSLPEVANGAAYLVNPYNIADIAEGMRRILSDQGLRNSLITAGKERARQYSWGVAAQNAMHIFQSLI